MIGLRTAGVHRLRLRHREKGEAIMKRITILTGLLVVLAVSGSAPIQAGPLLHKEKRICDA